MNKKRVLIFSLTYYPRFVGGAEVAIKEITDRLGDLYEFDMITLRFDRNLPRLEQIGNVRIFRIGPVWGRDITPSNLHIVHTLAKYLFVPLGFVKAISLHMTRKYNALWSMMASYNSFAALLFKKVHPSVPFLLTLQEGDPIPHIKRRARFFWSFFKNIFVSANVIQAISQYLGHFALEMGATCPIIVVPNGVDFYKFSTTSSEEDLKQVSHKMQKKDTDITLITTSRLVIKNGISYVLRALVHLPSNFKFVVLGIGPLGQTLKKEAAILGVEDRVIWLDHISHTEIPLYLKASDIFVRTPISEGFGNSYVEAMACGIPCIATPVGGILDFIKEGETGLYVDIDNPESIVDAVMDLVRNPDLVSKIKRQSFEMVKEKYDWDIVAEGMNSVFKSL